MSNATQTLTRRTGSFERRRPAIALSRRWLGAGTVVVIFLLWELAAVTGILPAASIPRASEVIAAFGALLVSPDSGWRCGTPCPWPCLGWS